jgi:hypothetical protein
MEPNAAGSIRPPFRRPTIVIGTMSTPLGRPIITPELAVGSGFYALDLDLIRAWTCSDFSALSEASVTRVRSVWIPRQYTGMWRGARAARLRYFLTSAVEDLGLRTVVVPQSRGESKRGTSLGQLARQISSLGGLRIAMRVGAETLLAQPGSHLDHVANLRRMAEEWDLDLSLDLTGPGIEEWEAEATLMRLFPRLTMVRIRPLHTSDGALSAESSSRVAFRTIVMLADQAYSGLISIAPEMADLARFIPGSFPPLRPVSLTRDEILAAYDRIDQHDVTAQQKKQQYG